MTPAASSCTKAGCTFTIETVMTNPNQDFPLPARRRRGPLPKIETPIVPAGTIGGHSLVAVVAIMTFLASLTTGAVMLVHAAAGEWQSEVAREITIQVRPAAGRDLEAEVAKAVAVARATPGVAEVRPYSKEESSRLLEPWLGSGLALDDLPVPRMIVLRLGSTPPDFAALRNALSAGVAGASLDDHRGWVDRMRAMARTAVAGGIAIVALVLVATVLSVTFATRGAMATNRPIVEVLHFIGAKNSFIAGQFQRYFLILGLKGGAAGGGAAIVLFLLAGLVSNSFLGSAGADQTTALFGTFSIGIAGYIAVLLQIALVAAVTAETSRRAVNRTLDAV
jgi:cell division transport system permease protein